MKLARGLIRGYAFFLFILLLWVKAPGVRAQEATQRIICLPVYELVTGLAWSPDGRLLAVAAGNQVRVYRTEFTAGLVDCAWNDRQWARLEIGALTSALQFSPNGNWLAVGSRDGRLRLWQVTALASSNAPTADMIWEAHRKGVNTLSWSPDGLRLASGGNDAVARIWDAASGRQVLQIIGGTFSVSAVVWSPDGAALAVANGGLVRLREVQAGRMLSTLQLEDLNDQRAPKSATPGTSAITPLVFSLSTRDRNPGWRLAIGETSNGLSEWDVSADGRLVTVSTVFNGHEGTVGRYSALVWDVAYSPGGELLASAGGDGFVRLWRTGDGTTAAQLLGLPMAVTSVAFNPSGEWLAAGSLDAGVYLYQLVGQMR